MSTKKTLAVCAAAILTVFTLTSAKGSISEQVTTAKTPPTVTETVPEYKAKDFSHLIGMKGFTKEQLELHFKLYEGYVKNANLLQQKLRDLSKSDQDRGPEYAGLKRMYGWEWDGMRLHELYFGCLGGDGKPDTNSEIYQAISKAFGSYEAWRKDFAATGLIRGMGWAVLYRDPETGRLVNTWINEHDLGHLAGGTPLLMMDVFEHAYITEYGLDRAKYIEAFFDNIDWRVVNDRFTKSK